MKRVTCLIHEFVEYIPEEIADGMLYISLMFATATHKCCCGCGNEVVTPLSPTDWKIIFDGESISIDPSIGNWSFDCNSHYWIENNKIRWARSWSQKEIDAGRSYDRLAKKEYYDRKKEGSNNKSKPMPSEFANGDIQSKNSLWSRLKSWWS